MSKTIEEQMHIFEKCTSSTEALLRQILDTVSGGCAPTEEDVSRLNVSFDALREQYNEICLMAAGELPAGELPAAGMPAAAYINAVANSHALALKKQLAHARKMLRTFAAVRSEVPAYADALAPYQEEVRTLLNTLCTDASTDMDELQGKLSGPACFLHALSCDEDSEESFEAMDALAEYYPRRVQQGVAAHKYAIGSDDGCSDDTEETASTVPPQFEEKSDSPSPIRSEKPEPTSVSDEAPGEVPGETPNDAPGEVPSDAPGEAVTESAFVKSLRANGALLSGKDAIGTLTADISPSEDRKITASVFVNDMRKGSERMEKAILDQLFLKEIITAELLSVCKGVSPSLGEGSLAYLQKKGYLRRYSLSTGGHFYALSPRLLKAMSFKECRKFAGLRESEVAAGRTFIEDKASSAAARIALADILHTMIKGVNAQGIRTYRSSVSTFTEAIWAGICTEKETHRCDFLISALWEDVSECDAYLDDIKEYLSKYGNVTRIFFAGLNAGKANALADTLLPLLEEWTEEADIYLYDVTGRCYCRYPSLEPVAEETLWQAESAAEAPAVPEHETQQEDAEEQSAGTEQASAPPLSVQEPMPVPNPAPALQQPAEKEAPAGKPSAPPSAGAELTQTEEDTILRLLREEKYYAAAAYARASAADDAGRETCRRLAYALNDPMEHCIYSAERSFDVLSQRTPFERALAISTALRTFFSNQTPYDYSLKPYYNALKGDAMLDRFPALSQVMYTLMQFKDTQNKGVDVYAAYRARNREELEQEIAAVRRDAVTFYDNFVAGRRKENASNKRFLETKKLMFSEKSDIGQNIRLVVEGDREAAELIAEFLLEHFFKEGETVSETSLDGDRIWAYIVRFWDMAGERMQNTYRTGLKSHLRSNITSITTKAVQLLARWCVLVAQCTKKGDAGEEAYKAICAPLGKNLTECAAALRQAAVSCSDPGESAGLSVLAYTTSELRNCILGNAGLHDWQYFYAPFLLSDHLVLDESFLPDFDMHGSELKELQPTRRILDHVDALANHVPSYAERFVELVVNEGDNYGTARLIIQYLEETNPSALTAEQIASVDEAEHYAGDTAVLRKADFIGELELAQSYGQIDNSVEDQKEKILQVADEWFEWAGETGNYGFFKNVLDTYLSSIRENAHALEADLQKQLDVLRETVTPGLDPDKKKQRILRIEQMLREQNYTVAEDLLARAATAEDEYEELTEEDFLKDFLENYDDYYQPVANSGKAFASLVSSRIRNKEERGAKRLAENWLPGGGDLGELRLKNLLHGLGFMLGTVKRELPISQKHEHFIVVTAATTDDGKRIHATHPITALGSGAARGGLRVVCMNGAYGADGLISVMKQIGNARNTLILLDYALTLSERRRLARKTKNALGDRLFAVVDRTVMMFLVRNYDETKINRMLASLVTPFARYQPYVWESANVMPPEIFMGRKRELERILSPSGANIVYGGRQLGKSALLKKAKEDIDGDEKNDRAVYLEIKGLDYKKAALKISHELFDQGILEKDPSTEDWDELARAIRQRLLSTEKPIPYLLLLLDEADAFIESCESVHYHPFDALKEVQSIGTERFKFVIAGLRNVVRFKRDAALSNNSVLTHLEAMTVKPFNTSEAMELLEQPLHYLGLRFAKGKEALITLILATTNYFPGLIQMYCAKLIDAMCGKDYAGYDEADSPVYEVSEEHIKKVLANAEFAQQIREKFMITLKLDEDNYYYLIALLMAYLYHCNGYHEGYSAEEIRTAGAELGIGRVAALDLSKLAALMEEMRELNVLRSTDGRRYLFTRFTFFQMMGTNDEVEDKLLEYMED